MSVHRLIYNTEVPLQEYYILLVVPCEALYISTMIIDMCEGTSMEFYTV